MQKEDLKFQSSAVFEGMTSIRAVIRAIDEGRSDRQLKEIIYDKDKMRKNAKESIMRNGELFSHTDIEYYLKEFDKRTNKNLCISVCLAVLSGIVTALMVIFRPFAEWLILVDMVAQIVLIISFISFALYIHDEVYKRILTFA